MPTFDRTSLYAELLDLLLPHVATERERQGLVMTAWIDRPLLHRVDWSGDGVSFASHLLRLSIESYPDGQGALAALLMTVHERVGLEDQARIDAVVPQLPTLFTGEPLPLAPPVASIRRIRIFLSSPGDVADERGLARQVCERLMLDPLLRGRVLLEVVAWDSPGAETPLLATKTPQEAINEGLAKPSECDVVVVILWARMGTPLPPEYVKPDGERYQSGTEWEYWDAYDAGMKTGSPYLLVYRRMEDPVITLRDPKRGEKIEQYERVEAFFASFTNPDGSIRQGYNPYDTPDQFRDKLETHLRSLIVRLMSKPTRTAPPAVEAAPMKRWEGSPFPGLRAFTPEDAPIFFGRGRETDVLLKRLEAQRFVAVVAASGAGKSSLVGAGVIPRLLDGALPGGKDWRWLRFTPSGAGENPFMALAVRLEGLTEKHGWNARKIAETLEANPAAMDEIAAVALDGQPEWAEVFLFMDQFEELFTLCAPKYVEPFAALLAAIAASKRVRAVATMRADFYHRCVDVPMLARLLNAGSFNLPIPDPLDLYEMIERPAQVAGLVLENGLTRAIVRDTGSEPGGLALMAYLLDELYQLGQRRGDKRLTVDDYLALGGVRGAIGTRAEAVYAGLDEDAKAALPAVFRRLVAVNLEGVPTRRRALHTDITRTTSAERLLNALLAPDARLLVQDSDARGQAVVEVAHEALFRSWGTLVEWIEQTKADLYLEGQVREAAQAWVRSGRDPAYLWSHERLQAVYEMEARLQPEWNAVEREFVYPEAERLLAEIDKPETPHLRRAFIGERLAVIGYPRKGVGVRADRLPEIEWLPVPGGVITLEERDEKLGTFTVVPFYLAKYPITYRQFQAFVDAPDGYRQEEWWQGLSANARDRQVAEQRFKFAYHPRETVNWYESVAFTRWLNFKLQGEPLPAAPLPDLPRAVGDNCTVRLPTEWEWQWAAQGGTEEWEFAWGDWQEGFANTSESGISRTTAVGMYPHGAATCGALDMIGNVREWCLNEYDNPSQTGLEGTKNRALRGGSWFNPQNTARAVYRNRALPDLRNFNFGFRLVVSSPISNR